MASTPPTLTDSEKAQARLDCLRLASNFAGPTATAIAREGSVLANFVIDGTVPQEPGQ